MPNTNSENTTSKIKILGKMPLQESIKVVAFGELNCESTARQGSQRAQEPVQKPAVPAIRIIGSVPVNPSFAKMQKFTMDKYKPFIIDLARARITKALTAKHKEALRAPTENQSSMTPQVPSESDSESETLDYENDPFLKVITLTIGKFYINDARLSAKINTLKGLKKTIDYCKDKIDKYADEIVKTCFSKYNPKGSSVLFWSECEYNGKKDIIVADTIAKEFGFKTLSIVQSDNTFKFCKWDVPKLDRPKDDIERVDMIKEFNVSSAFLAAQDIKIVYFVAGKGKRGGTTWTDHELPTLLRNPNVEKIIRIDHRIYGALGFIKAQMENTNNLDRRVREAANRNVRETVNNYSVKIFDREEYKAKHSDFSEDYEVSLKAAYSEIIAIDSVEKQKAIIQKQETAHEQSKGPEL